MRKNNSLFTSSSWYKHLLRLSQVWRVEVSSFNNMVYQIYRLQYMLFEIKTNEFSGVEKRKLNIIAGIEGTLNSLLDEALNVLRKVFRDWLSSHALLNPTEWAEQRVYGDQNGDYEDDAQKLDNMVFEYQRYNVGKRFSIGEYVNSYPQFFPSITGIMEQALGEIKNMELRDLSKYGLEVFDRKYGRSHKSIEEAQNEINGKRIEDGWLDHLFDDDESFALMLSRNGVMDEFLVECYASLVFPAWYAHWGDQGIDDVREAVERIYGFMESASDIGSKVSAVNLALNAVHMGGSMLEHVENSGLVEIEGNIVRELSALTAGKYISEWDSELMEMGVKIR